MSSEPRDAAVARVVRSRIATLDYVLDTISDRPALGVKIRTAEAERFYLLEWLLGDDGSRAPSRAKRRSTLSDDERLVVIMALSMLITEDRSDLQSPLTNPLFERLLGEQLRRVRRRRRTS